MTDSFYRPGDRVLVLRRRGGATAWVTGRVRSAHPTFARVDVGDPRPARVGLDRIRLMENA